MPAQRKTVSFSNNLNIPDPDLQFSYSPSAPSLAAPVSSRFRLFSPPLVQPSVLSLTFFGSLGSGSYSTVLLGHLREEPSDVIRAVKVVSKMNENTPRQELETLSWINKRHENAETMPSAGLDFLQKMVASVETDRHLFLILEYHPAPLSDPNIKTRLRLQQPARRPAISQSASLPQCLPTHNNSQREAMTALRLLSAELVLGLLFLHRHGIVHQDIKPSNIMISLSGHVVICDFGSSTTVFTPDLPAFRPGDLRVILQPAEEVTFTAFYASPELQIRSEDGLVVYDERVDWWSAGVVLYEMATGSYPHLQAQCEGDLPSHMKVWRTEGDFSLTFGELQALSQSAIEETEWWDPAFEHFITSLLEYDPEDRLGDDYIQHHRFFDPIQNLWPEIAALKYPPLPDPIAVTIGDLDFNDVAGFRRQSDPSFPADGMSTIASGLSSVYFDAHSRLPPSSSDLGHSRSFRGSSCTGTGGHRMMVDYIAPSSMIHSASSPHGHRQPIDEFAAPSFSEDLLFNFRSQARQSFRSQDLARDISGKVQKQRRPRKRSGNRALSSFSQSAVQNIQYPSVTDMGRPLGPSLFPGDETKENLSEFGVYETSQGLHVGRKVKSRGLPPSRSSEFGLHQTRPAQAKGLVPATSARHYLSQRLPMSLEETLTISVLKAMDSRDSIMQQCPPPSKAPSTQRRNMLTTLASRSSMLLKGTILR